MLCTLLPLYASAHNLHLVAQQQGIQLQGDAYYSDMKPAVEHYVGVFKHNDRENPIMESMTDKNGHIALTVPSADKHILVVEGAEGHKVSLEVPHITTADNNSVRVAAPSCDFFLNASPFPCPPFSAEKDTSG